MSVEWTILPCPFCGAPASIEEITAYQGVMFSVGCDSTSEGECMGYQLFQTFNTRGDAITAWNKRAPALPHKYEGSKDEK